MVNYSNFFAIIFFFSFNQNYLKYLGTWNIVEKGENSKIGNLLIG